MNNKNLWIKNVFPRKLFLTYLIAVIICFQIFITFIFLLIFSYQKYFFIIIFIYILISTIFITYFSYNYKKQKSQSEFHYKLTKKGIIIKKFDSTIKLIPWKNIRKIKKMSDVSGIYIHIKKTTWPFLFFGDKIVINMINDYYKNYH